MAETFLNVFDRTRKKTAVLQNAYNIEETQEINQIYMLKFSLPGTDLKNQYCQPFHFVRYGEDGQLYRIIKSTTSEGETSAITYECEHVICTLIDNILFGSFSYGGGSIKTADVISWLLSKQTTENWVLGTCDFTRKFEYGWEQENLLNALYSIPGVFSVAYFWDFDTTVYPWKVNLKSIDSTIHPQYYIRAKRNLLGSGNTKVNTDICTRIYPLGYGEGVNQLTIKDVNEGKAYIDAPQSVIDQYGLIEKVLVDRRFENAESLKEYGQRTLDAYSQPVFTRSFDVVDLYPITGNDIDNAKVADICRMMMDDSIAYVTKTVRRLDEPGNLSIELSTKSTSVIDTIADLADRVRIESTYAQGATQLYQHSVEGNAAGIDNEVNSDGTVTSSAASGKGLKLNLYFPGEMKQINKVLLKIKMEPFRRYSKDVKYGGASTQTSSSGGASTQTSSSGGASTTTSAAGGSGNTGSGGSYSGSTTSSEYNNSIIDTTNNGGMTLNLGDSDTTSFNQSQTTAVYAWDGYTHYHYFTTPSHKHGLGSVYISPHEHFIGSGQLKHKHNVNVSIPNHSHSVESHSHSVTIPAHTHSVSTPNHTHNVTIPAHSHDVVPGIYNDSSYGSQSFDVYVGSTKKTTVSGTSYDGDITAWILNAQNKIPRDQWITLELRPDKLAYMTASVFVQGFVQSRGGGSY